MTSASMTNISDTFSLIWFVPDSVTPTLPCIASVLLPFGVLSEGSAAVPEQPVNRIPADISTDNANIFFETLFFIISPFSIRLVVSRSIPQIASPL
jgi:hypothetical protein